MKRYNAKLCAWLIFAPLIAAIYSDIFAVNFTQSHIIVLGYVILSYLLRLQWNANEVL